MSRTGSDTRAVSESTGHIGPMISVCSFYIDVIFLLVVYSTALKSEMTGSFKPSVSFSQSTRHHYPGD
jgi:hypothetical protein